tara:strand:+ start:164 stop:808 length:645 start_codon:yes stop_codon:yes gene_type:complete
MLLTNNNNYIYKIQILFFLIILIFYKNTYASKEFNYFDFIKEMNSFSTSFIQRTYDENGALINFSKGKLLYKKQSKYVLEYVQPNKIKFISDGYLITTYDQDLEQAIIQSLKNKVKNNIVDIFTNENLIKNKFELKLSFLDGENHINFSPLDKKNKKNIFLLVIKEDKIKKITFVNDFDQSVTMSFNGFKKNANILDSSFKIDIPDSFDVIIDK